MPGWDEHFGYGILDLEKAIKSIDQFNTGYFASFDDLPYYEGPSSFTLTPEDSYQGTFTLMPNGAAGSGFNDITYTFNDSFLDVTTDDNDPSDGSTFTVEKDDDYNWSGWVNTPITFEFPMVSGGTAPYEGYELLAVTVNVITVSYKHLTLPTIYSV